MPKVDKNEKKKKELENLINEIKENAPDTTKGEIEELEKMLSEILEEEKRPLRERILEQVVAFGIHTIAMYIVSLLVFGFFFQMITVENKYLVFLFAGIISLVLVTYERIPRNPFRKNFIAINLMIFLIIIVGFLIINQDVYRVFNFSAVWVFYLITVEILYLWFEHSILKKIGLA